MWSASAASCGIPFVYGAVEILCKDENGKIVPWISIGSSSFVDGSIDCDLPLNKVSEFFNVSNFITSQVNPW